MTQICIHFSPFLFCVEDLRISSNQSLRNNTDSEQWVEFIRAFGGAKDFRVAGVHVTDILYALGRADGEHPTLLPSLRTLRVRQSGPMHGSLWEAVE